MKCPICGNNARQYIKDKKLMYKCLNNDCRAEVEKETLNSELVYIRERIQNILNSSDKNILISNIKKIRIEIGLNQGEISQALGFSAQRYGTIERCDNIPTVSKLMDIANIYGISLNELYTTVTLNEDEYRKLNKLVVKQEKADVSDDTGTIIVIEEDNKIEELEKEIAQYELESGISERKIFDNDKNKDTEEVVEIKKTLKKLDSNLVNYRKKKNVVLKQGTIVDYYNWIVAKDLIGYKEEI